MRLGRILSRAGLSRPTETLPRIGSLLARKPGGLHVRGLSRKDAPLLTEHLLRLSPEDRRTRFHGAQNDQAITAYVQRINWRQSYIFGLFVGGTLRGVAELVPLPSRKEAEIAVSVEPRHRHGGMGSLLVVAAILAARRLGLGRLNLGYQARNTAMRALAMDVGAETVRRGATVDSVITLPAAVSAETDLPAESSAPVG